MHISETPKDPIFKSDPGVYDTLAKANDIYGKPTLKLIKSLIQDEKMPFMIMEGVMDTLDGTLGSSIYRNYLSNSCQKRSIIKTKDSEGTCHAIGYV